MHATTTRIDRRTELALAAATVELTLITAFIHLTLGGALFTLNALGYAGLAAALAVSTLRHPWVRQLAWLPRIGLAGYTAATIGAYLVMGPYFTLGWVAKGVEIVILTLLVADLVLRYGSPRGLLDEVVASVRRRDRPGSVAA